MSFITRFLPVLLAKQTVLIFKQFSERKIGEEQLVIYAFFLDLVDCKKLSERACTRDSDCQEWGCDIEFITMFCWNTCAYGKCLFGRAAKMAKMAKMAAAQE